MPATICGCRSAISATTTTRAMHGGEEQAMSKSRKHHLRSRKQARIAKSLSRHHAMRAKARGGTYHPSNIMVLTVERHRLLHQLFGLKSIPEIMEVLLHWCKYRHILNGENDKGQIYEHFRKRFSEIDRDC